MNGRECKKCGLIVEAWNVSLGVHGATYEPDANKHEGLVEAFINKVEAVAR